MERNESEQKEINQFHDNALLADCRVTALRKVDTELNRAMKDVENADRGTRLKTALHCCKVFADFCTKYQSTAQDVDNVLHVAGDTLIRDRSGSASKWEGRVRDGRNARDLNTTVSLPSFDFDAEEFTRQATKAKALAADFSDVARSLRRTYVKARGLAEQCIAAYNRKDAYKGEREAISILKVWVDKHDPAGDKSSARDAIFGWDRYACQRINASVQIGEVLTLVRIAVRRNLRPGKGSAPSYKMGYETMAVRTELTKSQRRHMMLQRLADKYRVFSKPYQSSKAATVIVKAMQVAKQNRRALATARWVEKHFVRDLDMNGVPTVITGEPVRCEGNDYKVPCVWRRSSAVDSNRFIEGFVLLRRDWRGAYHTTDDMTDRQISRQLDLSASGSYWSPTDVKQLVKQRAATLRACRSREEIKLKESYAVGNCVPGTEAFCKTLGITTEVINGKELAKLWRAAKYPELNLFSKIFRQSAVAV